MQWLEAKKFMEGSQQVIGKGKDAIYGILYFVSCFVSHSKQNIDVFHHHMSQKHSLKVINFFFNLMI